jgi:hypothetical protein
MRIILKTYRPSFFSYVGYIVLFFYCSIVLWFSFKKEGNETIMQLKKDNILDEVRILLLILTIFFMFILIRFIIRNNSNYSEIFISDKMIIVKSKSKTKKIDLADFKSCNISISRKLLNSKKTNLIKEYDAQLRSAVSNIGFSLQIIGQKKVKISNIKEEEFDKICEFIKLMEHFSVSGDLSNYKIKS